PRTNRRRSPSCWITSSTTSPFSREPPASPDVVLAGSSTTPQATMIRVRTASRLHFGLLSLPCTDSNTASWPNLHGELVVPARCFGGVGLMIEAPGIELTTVEAPAWSATGPLAERVLAYVQRVAATLPTERVRPQHFSVL